MGMVDNYMGSYGNYIGSYGDELTNRDLGSAVAGKTAQGFNVAAGRVDSPAGVLTLLGSQFSKITKPIPAGQVLSFIGEVSHSRDAAVFSALNEKTHIMDHLKSRLFDDGYLSREELVRTVAETGNQVDSVKPAPSLVRQASSVLEKLGIKDDKNSSVAEGLAKTSVLAAVGIQSMEAGRPDLEKRLQELAPAPEASAPSSSPLMALAAPKLAGPKPE